MKIIRRVLAAVLGLLGCLLGAAFMPVEGWLLTDLSAMLDPDQD